MQALRLARPRLPLRTPARAFAAAAHPAPAASTSSSSGATVVPLSNVEAMWTRLSADEQLAIHQQLEELQKKDWKGLSLDEKKAGASRFVLSLALACALRRCLRTLPRRAA